MMKKPILNTIVQILGKIGVLGISLFTTGILTRKLGVSYYGNFVLISSLFVFLDSLADFGTKTIGVREFSKEDNKDILGHIFNLRLVMAVIAFGLGLALVWNWKGMVNLRWEATVAMSMIFLTSIAGYWEIVFQSKLRMDLKVVMDLCFPAAFLTTLWLWKGELNLMWVFSVYIIARLVSLIVGYWLVSGLSTVGMKKLDWNKMKGIWKMTWPMGVFLLMFATYDRAIDALLIQNYLGAVQVAWYGLAYKIYGALLQPAYFYVNSIFPMMSSKDVPKRRLFTISAGLMLVAAAALVIVVYFTAPLMVEILAGSQFGPSVMVLRILIIAALFSYMGHLLGFTLISQGGQAEMLKLGAVALVFNLALNIILIPRYGIYAAAWVTVLTEAIDCGLMGWFLFRKTKV
jgi:O-antigen/teichoic acid export membrane protein